VAIKLIRILEDDLDGTDASETLTFSLDGLHYEIDLNTEHAQELRTILAHYIVAGRKDIPVRRRTRASVRRPSTSKRARRK
jgi:hypothetical protein